MINYRSESQFNTPPYKQFAGEMPLQQSPYLNQNHQDIFRGLQQSNAVNLDRYAQQKQDEYESEASRAQRDLALAGLNMMTQSRNNQQTAQNNRLQMLLGGLL